MAVHRSEVGEPVERPLLEDRQQVDGDLCVGRGASVSRRGQRAPRRWRPGQQQQPRPEQPRELVQALSAQVPGSSPSDAPLLHPPTAERSRAALAAVPRLSCGHSIPNRVRWTRSIGYTRETQEPGSRSRLTKSSQACQRATPLGRDLVGRGVQAGRNGCTPRPLGSRYLRKSPSQYRWYSATFAGVDSFRFCTRGTTEKVCGTPLSGDPSRL